VYPKLTSNLIQPTLTPQNGISETLYTLEKFVLSGKCRSKILSRVLKNLARVSKYLYSNPTLENILKDYLFLDVHLVIVHCPFAKVSCVPIKISESLLSVY
jgi:hypothetical protein